MPLKKVTLFLECETCKSRNYKVDRNLSQQKKRLEIKKFCKRCGNHTIHRETK